MALNPRLQHKPVVIASNNDGVVVTGNAAAKALGLGMGVPLFKVQDLIKNMTYESLAPTTRCMVTSPNG